jgi:hypothetical protein
MGRCIPIREEEKCIVGLIFEFVFDIISVTVCEGKQKTDINRNYLE